MPRLQMVGENLNEKSVKFVKVEENETPDKQEHSPN